MIETLLGSLLGGVFRIVPEVMKMLDAKNEREHEAKMLEKEMEFAKIKGEIHMREQETALMGKELDAMAIALQEQGETARAAGGWVVKLSAAIRPSVTVWFVVLYSIVKFVSMWLAVLAGANWKEVLVASWTQDDMAILMMILTFYFTGRIWDRNQK